MIPVQPKMEDFLLQNPQFKEKAEAFAKIKRKEAFTRLEPIDKHIHPLKITDLKLFTKNSIGQSHKIREGFLQIAKNESSGIEAIVYTVFAGKRIIINDIDTMLLFYKELGEYRQSFELGVKDIGFQMQRLFLLKVAYDEDIFSDFF